MKSSITPIPFHQNIIDSLETKGLYAADSTFIKKAINNPDKSKHPFAYRGQCFTSGIRFTANTIGMIDTVTFSAARLHHGSNRYLITAIDQIHNAINQVQSILSAVTDGKLKLTRFQQLHLVWHLNHPFKEMFNALKHIKPKGINRLPVIYPGESLTFPGSLMRIVLYDKENKIYGNPGNYSRLEIQLSPKKVEEHFPELLKNPLKHLDIDKCWSVYREILLQFKPDLIEQYNMPYSQDALVAWVSSQTDLLAPDGSSLLEWRCSNMSNRHGVTNLKKKIGRMMPVLAGIDLDTLLPDKMPASVEAGRNFS